MSTKINSHNGIASSDSTDKKIEKGLRPDTWEGIVGRDREKKILNIAIEAAQGRGGQLDHILFHGPPGLGKTTFALVVAKELGVNIKITSGPAIERQGDLAAILTNLQEGGVLFIDEIHRLNKSVEEVLYPAMEDFSLDIIVGKGPSAKSMRLALPPFTLIGATTRLSLLSAPLRDRFGIHLRLDYFKQKELAGIVQRVADVLEVNITKDACDEIARRSRGTGRIAIRLLKRVRDYMEMRSEGLEIDRDIAKKALEMMEIDEMGLGDIDRKLLKIIINKFAGGPVGLATLASALSEDKDTLSDVIEPYLIKTGLIKKTKRGRVATSLCYEKLGIKEDAEGNRLL
jgi:Holliday junction DNA helicase RuvB